jgi:hypothetical protein
MRLAYCGLLHFDRFCATGFMGDGSWKRRRRGECAAGRRRRGTGQGRGHRRGRPLTPSQATDFSINGKNVVRAVPPPTAEELKTEADARSTWQVRCRPAVVEESEGIRRTKYAESDCDLSRFNTAGAQ